MKKVLVLCFSDLSRDPRPWRQIRWLTEEGFHVTAAGKAPPGIDGAEFVSLQSEPHGPASARGRLGDRIRRFVSVCVRRVIRLFIVRCFPRVRALHRLREVTLRRDSERRAAEALSRRRFDLIVANDLRALPIGVLIKGNGKLLYDAHEYSPRQGEDSAKWRRREQSYVDYLCRKYMPQADAVTTVCQSIADEYRRNYGVRADVVVNAAPYEELQPSPVGGALRLVHHGAAARGRKLELMIEAMELLDPRRFSLDFLLMPTDPGYLAELKRRAEGKPVRFLAPVPMQALPRFLNAYDIGLYVLAPASYNQLYALPNKLFEFIQARLAIAVGPSPEMAALVRRYNLGIVAEDFRPESLAEALAAVTDDQIMHWKRQSHTHARELSAEAAMEVFGRVVSRLLEPPDAAVRGDQSADAGWPQSQAPDSL